MSENKSKISKKRIYPFAVYDVYEYLFIFLSIIK